MNTKKHEENQSMGFGPAFTHWVNGHARVRRKVLKFRVLSWMKCFFQVHGPHGMTNQTPVQGKIGRAFPLSGRLVAHAIISLP